MMYRYSKNVSCLSAICFCYSIALGNSKCKAGQNKHRDIKSKPVQAPTMFQCDAVSDLEAHSNRKPNIDPEFPEQPVYTPEMSEKTQLQQPPELPKEPPKNNPESSKESPKAPQKQQPETPKDPPRQQPETPKGNGGNGILVGLPQRHGNCWINAALQVSHALYRDKILGLPDTPDTGPFKKIIQAMDTSIGNCAAVLAPDTFDACITDLGNVPNMKAWRNLKDMGVSIEFLKKLNRMYHFIEPLKVYRCSGRYGAMEEQLLEYKYPTINHVQPHAEIFKTDMRQPYFEYIIGTIPDVFIVDMGRIKGESIANLFAIDTMHASFFHHKKEEDKEDKKEEDKNKEAGEEEAPKQPSDEIPMSLKMEACIVFRNAHFYAYIQKKGQWYCVNDASVHSVSQDCIQQDLSQDLNNYICFYKKQ